MEHNFTIQSLTYNCNHVFGSGNWSHEIIHQALDFVDDEENFIRVGCYTLIRVELKDGQYHQEYGYGNAMNVDKSLAIRFARNNSTVDALYRTLCSFEIMSARFSQLEEQKSKRLEKQKQLQEFWKRKTEPELENIIITHKDIAEMEKDA